MRVRVGDPSLVASLLAFLRGQVHVVAEQSGPAEVEVSQLGSMNADARRLELDLLLRAWQTANAQAAVAIVD
jgi:hypothetical protein